MLKKKLLAGALSAAMVLSVAPASALANDGAQDQGVKTWKEIYQPLGVNVESGYDAVTSATEFKSGHAVEGSGAAGIPACISREKNESGETTALKGADIPGGELKDISLYKASHKTFEQAATNKKYGTDEFLIEPWDGTNKPGSDPNVWSWNSYFDSVYAVTVSDGKTTVGAVPWIDFYGQKGKDTGTSGVGHYNYVEIALNNGPIPTQPTMSVDRYKDFYDSNNQLKSGNYTVTVYSTKYKPLTAENIWVPARANAEVAFGEVTATTAEMNFVKALPEDYDPAYKVDGKDAAYSDGKLSFEAINPGTHNVVITSNNKDAAGNIKYGDVNASFVFSVNEAVAKFDENDKKLVALEGAAYTLENYIGAITKVNVNGTDYSASGKGSVKVINNDGTIDISKTAAASTKAAVKITAKAAGYPDLSFVYSKGTIDEDAAITINDQVYTGQALTPPATVTVNGTVLKEGEDFTVEYSNNIEAGKASATIKGKGDYAGEAAAAFEIAKADLTKASIQAIATQTYTGKALTPAVSVKMGNKALKKDKDYTVKYASNVNAGKAKVTVTGKGNYEGTKAAAFTIKKAAQKMTVAAAAKTVKAKKLKKKKMVIKNVFAVKNATGKLSYKVASKSKNLSVNAKNGNITVKKKTKKNTYKLLVNVTASGNANYNAASKTVTVKVKVR